MFKREFASPALYGVSMKNTPSGGDYDVIASWNQRLVYVEVKSSPPKGVEQSEISAFFSRMNDLLPEVAILFNDTQLRMRDKLVAMFEEELERRYGKEAKTLYPVERLVEELFHVQNHIFIVNSKKDVIENFQICLKHYLRHGIKSL
jgi:Holliday junction resolvase-like predicted endonuclease